MNECLHLRVHLKRQMLFLNKKKKYSWLPELSFHALKLVAVVKEWNIWTETDLYINGNRAPDKMCLITFCVIIICSLERLLFITACPSALP